MHAMVWVVVGGLAVLVTMALLAVARRNGDAGGDRDLGSISSSWLNENRATEARAGVHPQSIAPADFLGVPDRSHHR